MTRRAPGTGTIKSVSPGVWEVQVSLGAGANGKRRRLTRTVHGPRKAAEKLLQELATSQHPDNDGMTVSQLVEQWCGRPGLADTTLADYLVVKRQWIDPIIGTKKIDKLTPIDVERFYAIMRESVSESRVSRAHGMLSGSFKMAVRLGLVSISPIARVDPPSQRRKDPRVPTVEQMQKLLMYADEFDTTEMALFLRVAAVTGMRRGEIAGLQQDDVSDDEIVVRRSISYTPVAGIRIKSTKSGKQRRIAVDAATVQMIRHNGGRSWVFSDDGAPPPPNRFTQGFERIAQRTGIDCSLHHVRHFAATQALAGGVDVRTVANRLGHANPNVTLNVYVGVVRAADREAADKLAALANY